MGAAPPATARAFDAYVRVTESRVDALLQLRDSFLWADSASRRARVRQAGVVVEPRNGRGDQKVDGGLIHDWVGATFIPGATTASVLAFLQDYDHHKVTYQPEVIGSKILEHNGNDFKVRLRLLKHKVVTVVLDADSDIHYRPLTGPDWQSRSYSTRVVEISGAGGPNEHELAAAQDHGYLWRLNSYWLLRERDHGVYLECEAVSLSRGVPKPLSWLIAPIIRTLPKDALANTLSATRRRLLDRR